MAKATFRKTSFPRLVGIGCAATVLLCSCSFGAMNVASVEPEPTPAATIDVPMKTQLLENFGQGMRLEFSTLDLLLPGNASRGENRIGLSGASGQIRLDGASLHGLSVGLDAPIDYNGLHRELSLTLHQDDLYFSISADQDDAAFYDVKYHTELAPYDCGGLDETTKGISYYEYGDLDYVIAELLSILGVTEINLDLDKGVGPTFDWEAILDSIDAIVEYDSTRFLWELPIGENVYRLGLGHDASGVLSHIEFPLIEDIEQPYASLNEDFQFRLKASICPDQSLSWAPRYETNQYTDIVDSLSLFRQIAKLTQKKAFGVNADFSLFHGEDAIVGDETHFATEAVSESAYLKLEGQADLSKSFFGGINADIKLGQTGGQEKRIGLHAKDSDSEGITDLFLNVNDILKVRTTNDVCDALIAALKDAFSDDSIQNDMIMELLSSLLATANGISEAISAIKESAFYKNVNKKHFEDILSTIKEFQVSDNLIRLTVDLTPASLIGEATVLLNGTADHMSLGQVILDGVGLRSNNDSHTTFVIDGTLEITPYEEPSFDESGYVSLTHLPHWTEEIQAIADSDQLEAHLDGYALKRGTTARIHSTTANNYVFGHTEQGMAFHGSLAFDLKNRLGTGSMTFLDLKEKYVNDHNLKIDVTGEAGENDSDAKDMAGSGNENAMFFEYNAKNVTATDGQTAYSHENRKEPDSSNGMKGRFSVHSLNGIIDLVLDLTKSTDARFKRLTNLVSSLSTGTLIGKLLDGQYFELLSSKILTSVDISGDHATFVLAPGLIQEHTGLTLKLGYDGQGKPSTIEVWMALEKTKDNVTSYTDVYAKITLGATSFASFPFQFSDHSMNEFTDYSTIKTLLDFALGTITLGVTDKSYDTTYAIEGTIKLKVLTTTYTINVGAYIFLNGTNVKVLGSLYIPEVMLDVVQSDTYLNFYFETDGEDSEGDMFLRRITIQKRTLLSDQTETTHRRVHGGDLKDNLLQWLLNYMLNMGSIVTGNLDGDSASSEAMHGEDLITSYAVSGTLENPTWALSVSMNELTHVSLLKDLNINIHGKTATYQDDTGKVYHKKTLSSIDGGLALSFIGIEAASATIDLSIKNVSSSGAYGSGWDSASHKATIYQGTNSSKDGWPIKIYTRYTIKEALQIPSLAFVDATYGKNASNATYQSCPYYVTPDTKA